MPQSGKLMAALVDGMGRQDAPVKLARPANPNGLSFYVATPSERESSTPEDAIAAMNGEKFAEFGRIAAGLPGYLHDKPAYGFWIDGAEESRVVHHDPLSPEKLRHAMARVGLAYNQKGVIGFHEGEGDDQAHVFHLPNHANAAEAQRVLVKHGVNAATFVPHPEGGHTAVVLDHGGGNHAKIEAARSELGATGGSRHAGKILWEGDPGDNPTREVARQNYLKTLADTAHVTQL